MKIRVVTIACALMALLGASQQNLAAQAAGDWGLYVQQQMLEYARHLFGVGALRRSALGPFTEPNHVEALKVAEGLEVTLVSTAVASNPDMIAMWPNDRRPTHLFICNEEGDQDPSVQRIDLSKPPGSNATTILVGMSSCDPIRRTPWGTIVAGEEEDDGGLYEIFRPTTLTSPVVVTNRDAGTTSDPTRVAKRKAVGSLAFEGVVILDDGTMYYGDELRPGDEPESRLGGAIYKFVPVNPWIDGPAISNLSQSPLVGGALYGLQVGASDWGQGTEIGKGKWVPIQPLPYTDSDGNVDLRKAQNELYFTGYYRPEDMELDPIAWRRGDVRFCWANTGRMSNGGGSGVESRAIYGEVMCLEELPTRTGGPTPQVTRFVQGDPQANHFDNLAFQPVTGNLVILEDGGTSVVRQDGTTELRGNDIWMCLPDGRDQNLQTDGCIRIASLADTVSEPSGLIFTANGQTAFVSLQHRSGDVGAIVKLSGFNPRPSLPSNASFGEERLGASQQER